MPEYSDYQRKVISRYYENRDQIDQQRLSELVTSLYLETGRKQEKLWGKAKDVMLRLGVPPSRVDHVLDTRDPAILAEVVNDLQSGRIKPPEKKSPEKKKQSENKPPGKKPSEND